MDVRKIWLSTVALGAAVAWFGGCSGTSSNNPGPDSGIGTVGPGGLSGAGICQSACPKACQLDGDCDTSTGQLCCDYGAVGKVCQSAMYCPKFCTTDATCDTATGQACVRTTLGPNSQLSCQPASKGIKTCAADSDCMGTQVCCGIYTQPICLPANECPTACNASSDCNTTSGEVCCTSVAAEEPNLSKKKPGLCLNNKYEPCLKACMQSSDCDPNSTTPICCNNICQATCPKSCMQDGDCTGKICCKAPSAVTALPPHLFKVTPTCSGTPNYTSCASCGCSCPGCGTDAGTGACTGTPGFGSYSTCASCSSYWSSTCSTRCAGCPSTVAAGTCSGTTYPCSTFSGSSTYMTYCVRTIGCTWDSLTSTCSGTPTTPCSSLTTQTTCSAQYSCTWSSASGGTCTTGTLTPCGQLDSTTCSTQYGCSYSTGTTICSGTPTTCSLLTATMCSSQPGCTLM